jgi:uncharacterized protein YndB with AHSA1/START domain
MENKNLIAKAEVTIHATLDQVWAALVDPAIIKKYMFGAVVRSDWKKGSSIIWEGDWKGKKYEDKGEIINIEPNKELQYTHFSPLSGLEDKPENYHTVTIRLSATGAQTKVVLEQDKNATEKGQQESQKNWEQMLRSLKDVVEQNLQPQ